MKTRLIVISIFFSLFNHFCHAQSIINEQGKQRALNEEVIDVLANPEESLSTISKWGFRIHFNFTIGLSNDYKTYYLIKINKYDFDTKKGFYWKSSPKDIGRYYPCSSLSNLCNDLVLKSLTIRAIWTYKQKEYETGSILIASIRGDFLKSITTITLPGGTDIPYEAVKSGEAKVTKIKVMSWDTGKEDQILTLLRNKNGS